MKTRDLRTGARKAYWRISAMSGMSCGETFISDDMDTGGAGDHATDPDSPREACDGVNGSAAILTGDTNDQTARFGDI
ncbi:hypothetical protein KJ819_02845 [Patescibacteria group bacterium]|nr:hypothetical protein [Patescibacteria group bacterium]MBU1500786.1 hypothetical protein [Patescibacteria group bacterium]MBU2080841.1 hypothetical protein [Patescibacteria group bacterium]MBU2123946.1 hypothetical protein [Patescibacteria group bacterium]MBU2194763.1 hypothetical protein [Patescibacteria group bacterium]